MGFQVSPGVEVKEIDLTNVIPAVSTSIGGFSGYFKWGPIDEISLLGSEKALLQKFGTPDSSVLYADPFFQAASFLEYGEALKVVRAGNSTDFSNATDNGGADNYTISSIALGGLVDGTYLNKAVTNAAGTQASGLLDFTVTNGVAEITDNVTFTDDPGATIGLEIDDSDSFAITGLSVAAGALDADESFRTGSYQVDFGTTGTAEFVIDSSGSIGFASGFAERDSVTDADSANFTLAINIFKEDPDSPADSPVNLLETTKSVTIEVSKFRNTVTVQLSFDGTTDNGVYIPNDSFFEDFFSNAQGGTFAARCAGTYGNGLKIYALGANSFQNIALKIGNGTVTSEEESVYNSFDAAPGDGINVAVVDALGTFGVAGTILEKFAGLSYSKTAKTENGSTNYIKNVINAQSRFIYLIKGDTVDYTESTFDGTSNGIFTLSGGLESSTLRQADVIAGLDLLADVETVDVNLLFSQIMPTGESLQNHVHKIAYQRKDAVAFLSPFKGATVGSTGPKDEVVSFATNITDRGTNGSYGVMDSGAVYIYDRYNDVYRFIPANGHVAGLCANTDDVAEPWFSPAGFNRGGLRSIVKLAFNPTKIQRDELYKAGVNPIASFPGQGTVLFGDKTAQSKPSAFDRINVRRLFIVLEKAIATAAKFQLFELNDEFTRATFRNAVEPFLRDVQGRRGITDFLVICDDTNNTGEVIDTNRFVADIYIKPARSINFITLNFIATRTGVDFSEIAGLSNA